MMLSVRYPHVRDLVEHYANREEDRKVINILSNGLSSEEDAKHIGSFIWRMLDLMSEDRKQGISVLGGIDNTQMAPDISYEMDSLMYDSGYGDIWEKISDEA